ncbi:hypothetical protein MTYP_01742 [Methylophilaceae bacterium]|nr:hypothetical protein MTYP_01742 [Methylophilaceae bacterium]
MNKAAIRGFTIIELMLAIFITAILLALAIPSFKTMLLNYQLRTVAEGINNGLQLARAEAVRRNTNVEFTLGAGSDWTVGCQIEVGDDDGDGVDDCPLEIQSKSSNESGTLAILSVQPAGTQKVTFNGLGRVTANNDGTDSISRIDIDIDGLDEEDSRDLRIVISGGSVHFCDPNVTADGDPRAC